MESEQGPHFAFDDSMRYGCFAYWDEDGEQWHSRYVCSRDSALSELASLIVLDQISQRQAFVLCPEVVYDWPKTDEEADPEVLAECNNLNGDQDQFDMLVTHPRLYS